MRWAIPLGRVAGIEVRIHLTFVLFLVWIAFTHYLRGGMPAALSGLVFLLLLFGSVLLHEFGHALAARRYGIPTPDITLLPIGGVARMVRMPDDPRQELVVALAGPAVNVLISGVLVLVLGRMTDLSELLVLDDSRVSTLAKLLSANVILVLFNLIPAFPMDGGRVLRAALALRMDYVRATQIAASLGQGFAFLFGFLGLFVNPLLVFIALFVYLGATQEAAATEMRNLLERLPVSAGMVTDFRTLPLDATVRDAVEALLRTSQHEFPVLDGSGAVHGVLTRDDLIASLSREGPDAPVSGAMRQNLPAVLWRMPFEEAVQRMQQAQSPVLPVTDDHGRLVGLITPENIGEMMMIQSAPARGQRSFWSPGTRYGAGREVSSGI